MKVGLLSMQRVNNYGSFWQAYCLRETISQITGESVDFIDIIPGDSESITVSKRTFRFSKLKRIPYYYFQRKKKIMFKHYQASVLGCSEDPNYNADYSSIIIGSDEVFNFVQKSPWGFTSQLYGNIDNSNVNTYAACFGFTTIEDINRLGRLQEIKEGLNNIRNISVRDTNSAKIVEEIIEVRPSIHLDPVLIGVLPQDLPDIKYRNYILVYSYDFRLCDADIIEQVKSIAKDENLAIYSVGFYQEWVDKNILPNPYELLSYFKNAKYIITDTFHGTIFSSRMHKQFVTVVRETNIQKLGDLLERINMVDRKYSEGDDMKTILDRTIDYEQFEHLRLIEKERSEIYIKSCMC